MKTIAYIRVSTSEQNTKVQKTEILEYSNKNKILIEEFIEVEISSRKNQEQRKIEYLKEKLNRGDRVITTELSRLARSMIEILTLIEYFKENQIQVIFTKQPELSISDDNALSTLLFAIYGYFAQTERELLSQRVKAGIRNAKAEGKKIGRPKGRTGKSKFDQDKDRILELRNLGLSYQKIANHLKYGTAQGVQDFLKKTAGTAGTAVKEDLHQKN